MTWLCSTVAKILCFLWAIYISLLCVVAVWLSM